MPLIQPFEDHAGRYEDWFERNRFVYLSELEALRRLLPPGFGVEIGSGSGRFSLPVGIDIGLDPSMRMNEIARAKGLSVVCGTAEAVPFLDHSFDFVIMVTTVCFVDDIQTSFAEVRRVLKTEGNFLVGFIDRNSPVGRSYESSKDRSEFYKFARFYSTNEIVSAMENVGFGDFSFVQTIFRALNEISSLEPVMEGFGRGSFVVVRAVKV